MRTESVSPLFHRGNAGGKPRPVADGKKTAARKKDKKNAK